MKATIRNDILEVSVKSLGAELASLKTVQDQTEFLWQGNPDYWQGQSPVLFPIIGGLPDGKYELYGQSYEMRSHGFARFSEFEVATEAESELVFRLTDSEETLRQYPFRFELLVGYRIYGNTLYHSFAVTNSDEKPMLFSVGAHPAINCPWAAGERMDDYRLVFEKPETLQKRLKVGVLLSGEKEEFMQTQCEKELAHSLFYDGAAILDGVASRWLEIRSRRNDRVVRFDFAGFPYLGIWSAKNDAPFVCIEPWYGVDSTLGDPYDLTRKEGLLTLEPGGSFRCEYAIAIE